MNQHVHLAQWHRQHPEGYQAQLAQCTLTVFWQPGASWDDPQRGFLWKVVQPNGQEQAASTPEEEPETAMFLAEQAAQ